MKYLIFLELYQSKNVSIFQPFGEAGVQLVFGFTDNCNFMNLLHWFKIERGEKFWDCGKDIVIS